MEAFWSEQGINISYNPTKFCIIKKKKFLIFAMYQNYPLALNSLQRVKQVR